MKIRNGFVSNSSSSSFIVHKADFTEEKWEGLKELLLLIRDDLSNNFEYWAKDWSGTGIDFVEQGNFIEIGNYYIDKKYSEMIRSYLGEIYPEKVYYIDG